MVQGAVSHATLYPLVSPAMRRSSRSITVVTSARGAPAPIGLLSARRCYGSEVLKRCVVAFAFSIPDTTRYKYAVPPILLVEVLFFK